MTLYNCNIIYTKRALVLLSLAAVLCILVAPRSVEAAAYNLTADKDAFVIGDTFNVDVKIDSADVGVNAAQATITFPKDAVQVTSLDKSSSAFDLWIQGPSYTNDTGQVTFIGGSQSGISGKSLEVLRITFKVKGSGAVGIIFSDGAVTASDGSGTNVLSAMNGLHLTSVTSASAQVIAPKPVQIVRPTVVAKVLPIKPVLAVALYPDQAAWYASISRFIVQWDLPRDVTDVATSINQQPSSDPTKSEGLFNNKTFSPLADGIWYLHVQFKNTAGWGPTMHYRIGIDSIPPLSFTATSPDGLTTSNIAPVIEFSTTDQPSGVSGYKVLVDGVVATTTMLTTYTLPPQAAGKHAIVVEAIDKAGNTTESRTAITVLEAPLITIAGIRITPFWFYMTFIVTLAGGLVLGRYFEILARKRRRNRIVLAQRDVQAAFNLIEKDVDSLLKMAETQEKKVVLNRIAETASRFGKYIAENVEEIEG